MQLPAKPRDCQVEVRTSSSNSRDQRQETSDAQSRRTSLSLPSVIAKGCKVSQGRVELCPVTSCLLPANRAEGGRGNIKVGAFPWGTSRNNNLSAQESCSFSARLCSTTGDVLGTVLAVGRQVGDRLVCISLRMTNQIQQRLRRNSADFLMLCADAQDYTPSQC